MTHDMQHISAGTPGLLQLAGKPDDMLAAAKRAADALVKVVRANGWEKNIGGGKHLQVEAWQTLAHFYGVSARVLNVEPYVDELSGAAGFKATAEAILISTDQVIGRGFALCLNNEENWDLRPKYEKQNGQRVKTGDVAVPSFQLQSMAQTRAIGKTLRGVLAFVVALAGFNTTPAEEMTGAEPHGDGSGNGNAAERISDAQRKMLFARAKEHGCPMNNLALIFQKKYGFAQAFEITKDKLDLILEDVKNWKNVPEAQIAPAAEAAK